MKKVLITGVNSYVGNSLEKWLKQYPEKYHIEKISLRDGTWEKKDFSKYSSIVHVAGIAHVSRDSKLEEKYYKINRDLTIEVAKKAKNDGVNQFVFLSSIIVYGDGVGENGIITRNTIPKPRDIYGNSKLQAEEGITLLNDKDFKVAIIRPPMIYGKGSKGNYPKLAKIARKLPIFPDIDNTRSMLHIDNLSEFLRFIIENEESGLFFPQNREYVKTSEMVKLISNVHGNKIKLIKLFNPMISLIRKRAGTVDKVFGDLVYNQSLSKYKDDYRIREFKESILRTERVKKRNKNNIDVLIMADNSLETVGGEQESTKIIINGVKDKYSLGVIQPGEIRKPGAGVHYYPLTSETRIKHLIKTPLSFVSYIWKIKRIISRERPRVIHTQAQVSFFIVSLLKKLMLIPKRSILVHTERGLYTKYSKFFRGIFHFFMKELDILVTTTEFNMKYWKKALNGYRMGFKIIENTAGDLFEAYDVNFEKPDNEEVVLGFAGRYTDWKNWPLAVEISEKLNEKLGGNLRVNMAVGCLDKRAEKETSEMFGRLSKIFRSRFNGKVNINLEEMNKFYYDVDVFILTSNYNTESFGRTLVEAMSRKTVVLTTNAGGSVEVVGNKKNVCENADCFVDRILYFYKNKELMKKEKESNYIRAKQVYSLKNNIDKHLLLYSEILSNKGMDA